MCAFLISACVCLITGTLAPSETPGMPPRLVTPQNAAHGGLMSTRGCATGVYYYQEETMIIEVRRPHYQRIIIKLPALWGTADFSYCFGASSARVGNALVAVNLDD